jgi:hypothetical protein
LKRLTVILCTFVLVGTLGGQSISVRVEAERVRVNASRMHFLVGDALSRLRDGATVKYAFELSAKVDKNGRVLGRTVEEFVVSYDLWEEKFAVKKLGSSPRTISHMSSSAAEAWCLDNISIATATLPANQPFWIRLEYRAAEPDASADQSDNSGFTLTGLIDIFSRRPHGEQLHGSEEVGPLRLENLNRPQPSRK